MSDRRWTWVRSGLARIGRALMAGLTAMGSCWCGGVGVAALQAARRDFGVHGDVEVHDEAVRGIAQIEAYLTAVDQPTRLPDRPRRRKHRGNAP